MRFGVLGTIEAWPAEGDALPLGGPRQRALLGLLLLEAGRIVGVQRLIDRLYGENPPGDAVNALQSQVSRLRRSLPDGLIEFHETGYRIAVAAEDVDAHRFEQLAGQGSRLLAGDPAQAAALLGEALDLWRGPVGDPRLTELRLAAEEDLTDARLALGEHAALVPVLRERIAAHPLRERPRAQLMQALSRAGRHAEALAEFDDARRTLADQLGTSPSAELTTVHESLLRTEARPRPPAQLTGFVGRRAELDRIAELLTSARLVTIIGPGGAGKTRLAIESAGPDASFVDLSSAQDLAQAVLTALGVRETGLFPSASRGGTTQRLLIALADREILLVLDNCEHVVDEAAELCRRLLTGCPGLRILATSREPLGITGEHLCPLPPLPIPDAVRLFTERATAVSPGFHGHDETVRTICAALDGLPLAIELAAARLRAMPVGDIAARLDDRFQLLSRGDRTAAPRHRTLRAVVEWSWDLLSTDEQTLATRLTVFTGGATEDAVERVCGRADLLPDLVDKSLVEYVDGRYRMLDTIRAFCAERAGDLHREHAEHFLDLAAQADRHLRGSEQLHWLARLDNEHGNLHAALRWAIDNDLDIALCLFGELSLYWYLRGMRGEAAALAEALLAKVDEPPERWDEEFVLCVLSAMRGRTDAPEWHDQLKLAEARMVAPLGPLRRAFTAFMWGTMTGPPKTEPQRPLTEGDLWSEAFTELGFALIDLFGGRAGQAARTGEVALAGFRTVGDRWAMVLALDLLARIADFSGDRPRFHTLISEAMEHVAELGSVEDQAQLLCRRAYHSARGGDLAGARADYEQAVLAGRRAGSPELVAEASCGLGDVARFSDDLTAARGWYELALGKSSTESFTTAATRARVQVGLGRLAEAHGDMDLARSQFDLAVTTALAGRNLPEVAPAADGLAAVALHDGDPELAAILLGAAVALRGMPVSGDPDVARTVDVTRRELGERFEEAYRSGAAMTRDEALTLLGERPSAFGA